MNEEYRIMNVESGKNIPVLRTLGYYAISYSTKITGALHLGFQTTGTAINDTMTTPRNILSGNRRIWNEKPAAAPRNILTCIQWICRTSNGEPAAALRNTLSGNRRICRTSNGEPAAAPRNTLTCIQWICRTSNGDTAAAPRNICRTAYHSSERKVHRTETLIENVEYRIMNNKSGRNIPVRGQSIPEGLHVYRKAVNKENSTPREVGISTSFQPAGVAQPSSSWYFYKHLIPLESGSQKTEGERAREC